MGNPIRDIGNRVMMMFARGVLRSVNDSNGRQQLQVELLKGELRDGVERMQNYGFTSHPTGGDVAFAAIGGNREQGIVLVVDDRRYRIPLEAGEVAMYDDLGNKIELLRDMIKVTAVQHVDHVPLEAGEVAMYDDLGNKIELLRDMINVLNGSHLDHVPQEFDLVPKVELLRDMIKVTAVQHVEVEAPTIKIIGNLEVVGNITTTGTITNNGKHVDSTHTHSNSGAGVPN